MIPQFYLLGINQLIFCILKIITVKATILSCPMVRCCFSYGIFIITKPTPNLPIPALQSIGNCWVSAKGAKKLHLFSQRDVIILPLEHLHSNYIISTLFYCKTVQQFLMQGPQDGAKSIAPLQQACLGGAMETVSSSCPCNENCFIVGLLYKVLMISIDAPCYTGHIAHVLIGNRLEWQVFISLPPCHDQYNCLCRSYY